jgi:tetratricopeptide (TPR) repeat protein
MKQKYFLQFLLVLVFSGTILPLLTYSQNTNTINKDIITTRDTLEFSYQIKNFLIPKFENLINLLSNESTEANLCERILGNISNEAKLKYPNRLFYNENSLIENDLFIGADTTFPTQDIFVGDYLRLVNTQLQKAKEDETSVSITIKNISSLKRRSFYYYKVYSELKYNTALKNSSFIQPTERVFEVIVNRDSTWQLQIQTIRFARVTDHDTLNDFKQIVQVEIDANKIINELLSENEKQKRAEKKVLTRFVQEGDDAMSAGDYEKARDKYREAYIINSSDKQLKNKLEHSRKEIEKKLKEEAYQKYLSKKIKADKEQIQTYLDNCKFQKAKILCDSLVIDYKVKDTTVTNLQNDLSGLSSAIASFEATYNLKSTKEVESLLNNEVKKEYATKNKLYKSDLYYQFAKAIYVINPDETKQILKSLNESVQLSSDKHLDALELRAFILFNIGDFIRALNDATKLIEYTPREAYYYIFRAKFYTQQKYFDKAIQDYAKAIEFHTSDTTVYYAKAELEFNNALYSNCELTCTAGIPATKCYGLLLFLRTKCRIEQNKFIEAGKDFREAVKCGITIDNHTYISHVIDSFLARGDQFKNKEFLKDALIEYSKTIDLDSTLLGLLKRGQTYLKMKNYDLALSDLNTLDRKNKNIQETYITRGQVYFEKELYYEAMKDFEKELTLNPQNATAHYYKGLSKMRQNKFKDAATSFERSNAIAESDSALFNRAWAEFGSKNYAQAIIYGEKAIALSKQKRWESYYVVARAQYEMSNYKAAADNFDNALKINSNNKEVIYWSANNAEKGKKYLKAIDEYSKLFNTPTYRDTCTFRVSICLIRTEDNANIANAENKLKIFENASETSYSIPSNLWLAYIAVYRKQYALCETYLKKGIGDENNIGLYYLVYSCYDAQQNKEKEALEHLEKCLSSKQIENTVIENEKMLSPISRKKIRLLIKKYFPDN